MSYETGRVIEAERLATAGPRAATVNLREIAQINRWFGGHRTLLRVMRPHVPPHEAFSVLDVGAASGDMGRCIRARYPNAAVTSLDSCTFHLRSAMRPRVAADAFRLPFRRRSFDFVICSSLLHHFPDREVAELIAGLRRVARRALIVLDLERRALAYYFLPFTKWLLGWSDITVHDGRLSVQAAFRAEELACLARESGAVEARVRRHRPWCRLSLVLPA